MTTRVKICGVTCPEDAVAACDLGADMIGLNFYAPSPRAISLDRAREIRDAVVGRCQLVGVFVNAARDFIEERLSKLALDLLQFHGEEDDDELRGWAVPVIRALRLQGSIAPDMIDAVRADYVL